MPKRALYELPFCAVRYEISLQTSSFQAQILPSLGQFEVTRGGNRLILLYRVKTCSNELYITHLSDLIRGLLIKNQKCTMNLCQKMTFIVLSALKNGAKEKKEFSEEKGVKLGLSVMK